QLAPLIDRIHERKPDLILFTGDLFDADVIPYADACVQQLQRLTAPLGKYAVAGNHDYYTGAKLAMEAYKDSGFQLLRNESVLLHRSDQTIQLVGLDDMFYGNPNIDAAFSGLNANQFTLLM